MANDAVVSHSAIDLYEYLRIIPNADGSLTRNYSLFPITEATPGPDYHTLVLSKDVPVNPSNNTWVRIFLPRLALGSSSTNKLPLIVHFHGGGFILFSAATNINHDFCSDIAVELPAVIASVEYRLAPEHRLPAAYDDAMEALHWIKATKEDWLQKYADLSRCFLMGSSAGANIAYHAGLCAAAQVDNLLPLKIRGLILHQPYFGGAKRTDSELRLANDPLLPVCVNDLMWELSLPVGTDRDHKYCNSSVGSGSKLLDRIRSVGWKVMVTGCDGDPLIDRQIEVVKIMEQKNVEVVSYFDEGGHHGVELFDLAKREALQVHMKNFVLSSAMAKE